MCLILLSRFEIAESQTVSDSYYLNKAGNAIHDPEFGEIATDLGGQIPFAAYGPGHPYAGAKDLIFDYDALSAYLTSQNPPLPPISVTAEPWPDSGSNSGIVCASWLPEAPGDPCPHTGGICQSNMGYYYWERYRINGAIIVIKWDPHQSVQDRHVFLDGPGSFSNGWSKLKSDSIDPDPCDDPYFVSGVLDVNPSIIKAGHLFVEVVPTYGHNIWSHLLRMNDVLWYLGDQATNHDRQEFAYDRAYAVGGSWAALTADTAALLDPSSITAVYGGGMMPDFGFNTPIGGWRMINAHRDAAMGLATWLTPPRSQSWDGFYAVEQMGVPPDYFSEAATGAELGGFSLLQRQSELQRLIIGLTANVDRHFNHHWYMPEFANNSYIDWKVYQLMGHGEPPPIEGQNEYYWANGPQILQDLIAESGPANNPPIEPPGPIEPYPNPYDHTLSDAMPQVAYGPSAIPFLTEKTFTSLHGHGVVQRIGQGIYPGLLDSLRVGDFDRDANNGVEVIFGNFDGFLHSMNLEEGTIPLLQDTWRSRPLAWGVTCVDVGPFMGGSMNWILAADSTGRMWRTPITGSGSYGMTVPFAPGSTDGSYLAYLRMGHFTSSSSYDLIVQDQFHRFLLFNRMGALQSKTDRLHIDPATQQPSDAYTGMTGLPHLIDLDDNGKDELLIPCMDGYLKRLEYVGGQPSVHVYTNTDPTKVFHLRATLHCCLPYESQGNQYVIVGCIGHPDIAQSDDEVAGQSTPFLACFKIEGDSAHVISVLEDPLGIFDPPVAMEFTDESTGKFVLASGPALSILDADDFISPGSNPPPPSTVVRIPGLPEPSQYAQGEVALAPGKMTITALEVMNDLVIAATPSGRIYLYTPALDPTRMTDDLELPNGLDPLPAPANFTLGWTFGVDHQPATTNPVRPEALHFLEGAVPYLIDAAGKESLRVGTLDPSSGIIDEFSNDLVDVINVNQQKGLRDLDIWIAGNPSVIDYRVSVEVADVSQVTGDLFSNFLPLGASASGGYIFRLGPSGNARLNNFDVPILSSLGYSHYPSGSNRYRGQYTTQRPADYGLYHGNSLMVAPLPVGNGTPPREHQETIVVGTLGGMVYGIDPTVPVNQTDDAALTHHLDADLGWGVMGLDVGDVDGDGENEIVVGTWLDDASFSERNDVDKHRGNVVILDCDPTGSLTIAHKIVLDPTISPGRFASGILGVKIDDTNNDGKKEIWCGDASGAIYCLGYHPSTNSWEAFYRTASVGTYPGIYNNFYPIKDAYGHTEYLIVFTPGYVYRFEVNGGSPW